MAIYSWFTYEKWWFSMVMLVYQSVVHTSLVHQNLGLKSLTKLRAVALRCSSASAVLAISPSQWMSCSEITPRFCSHTQQPSQGIFPISNENHKIVFVKYTFLECSYLRVFHNWGETWTPLHLSDMTCPNQMPYLILNSLFSNQVWGKPQIQHSYILSH